MSHAPRRHQAVCPQGLVDPPFWNINACTLVEWRAWQGENPRLCGHCDIRFGEYVVCGIPIFLSSDGTWSPGFPAVPKLDGEGRVKMFRGRPTYYPVIAADTAEAREAWRVAILTALHEQGIGQGP
jgi:hypothetical protein